MFIIMQSGVKGVQRQFSVCCYTQYAVCSIYYIEGLQTKQAQPGLQTCQEIILTFYPPILSTPAEVIQKR